MAADAAGVETTAATTTMTTTVMVKATALDAMAKLVCDGLWCKDGGE